MALAGIPLSSLVGSTETAVLYAAIAAGAYLVAVSMVLYRRLRGADIAMTMWVGVAGFLDLLIVVATVAVIITGSLAVFQVMLILFLARPMVAFLFVLACSRATPRLRPCHGGHAFPAYLAQKPSWTAIASSARAGPTTSIERCPDPSTRRQPRSSVGFPGGPQ